MTRIAIVGTGPAAYAVVRSLRSLPSDNKLELTLIGPDRKIPQDPLAGRDPRHWSAREYNSLHRATRRRTGWTFPPPRLNRGVSLENWGDAGAKGLSKSQELGGLGNYWSTSLFPFRSEVFDSQWPITRSDLHPYYVKVAEWLGLAATDDALNEVFDDSYATRPPIVPTPLCRRLVEAIGQADAVPGIRLVAGLERLAVETRSNSSRNCVYCGGCMYGCFRGSMFSPARELRALVQQSRVRFEPHRVQSIEPREGRVKILLESGETRVFERVFLCAGALGTTEIIMRSFGLAGREVFIDDNEMYVVPILCLTRPDRWVSEYFPLANSVIALRPGGEIGPYVHIIVAPLPSYLFDFYLPKQLTDFLRLPIQGLQNRVLLAAIYVDGATAARYSTSIDKQGELRIRLVRRGESDFRVREAQQALRRALAPSGFRLLSHPLFRTASSVHHAGGFHYAQHTVPVGGDSAIDSGVYICDSTVFPRTPAEPPTFSIMANAVRTVYEAMG